MSEAYWQKAQEFWEQRTQKKLTRADVREIMENLIGFFAVLEEWASEVERKKKAAARKSARIPRPKGGYGWIRVCAA